jgi:hypothetical protein
MKLPKPYPDPFNYNSFRNCRGTRYLGAAAFVGKGPMGRAHMHATAGVQDIPDDFQWTPDPERLARELEVDTFFPNTGRIWTFDHGELQNGYIIDYDGAKMGWLGEMTAEDCVAHFQHAYLPTLLYRLTKWIWNAGKEAHMLREPNGTVWVMQEMTTDVDKSLTIDTLRDIGPKLKLPEGWTYETKVLTKDLVLDTRKSDGWACILRDDLHLTYQACGYDTDTSANYIP